MKNSVRYLVATSALLSSCRQVIQAGSYAQPKTNAKESSAKSKQDHEGADTAARQAGSGGGNATSKQDANGNNVALTAAELPTHVAPLSEVFRPVQMTLWAPHGAYAEPWATADVTALGATNSVRVWRFMADMAKTLKETRRLRVMALGTEPSGCAAFASPAADKALSPNLDFAPGKCEAVAALDPIAFSRALFAACRNPTLMARTMIPFCDMSVVEYSEPGQPNPFARDAQTALRRLLAADVDAPMDSLAVHVLPPFGFADQSFPALTHLSAGLLHRSSEGALVLVSMVVQPPMCA